MSFPGPGSFAWAAAAILIAALVGLGLWLWTPDKSREELESRYLDAPTDMVDVAGLRLHVRDTGPRQAPAVILIHGFGSSLHTWEAWAGGLSTDYRVVRFDLPGSGLSEPDPTGDYTVGRSVEILQALMDGMGIDRASLVGNSMGGRVAWNFAARNPGRVEKLVLISPDGFASPGEEYGRRTEVPLPMKLMRYTLPRVFLRMNLAPAYGDPARMTDAYLDRYHDLIRAPGVRDALIARMEQAVREDPVPLLRRIEAPTLLLWGEKDALIPVANAEDYLRALPHGTLVRLPGIGHVPQEEAPAATLEPVKAFLAR
ncbi:alpha/beta fold hydrolase [Skermanella mucosa]|uniref:alpha/beta fold hydrolase n=1 Tax=Skermanella mucosa TaxID=1789672 RepID=UPI00192B3C4B|nr:alpha/beta fold hydrolase [Skermanella mucosa]UEM19093.1 alpha/beta fold hydrolase [Skermanella mucosa]